MEELLTHIVEVAVFFKGLQYLLEVVVAIVAIIFIFRFFRDFPK